MHGYFLAHQQKGLQAEYSLQHRGTEREVTELSKEYTELAERAKKKEE